MSLPTRNWLRARCPSHIDPERLADAVNDPTSVVHAAFCLALRYQREFPAIAGDYSRLHKLFADEDDVIPTRSRR